MGQSPAVGIRPSGVGAPPAPVMGQGQLLHIGSRTSIRCHASVATYEQYAGAHMDEATASAIESSLIG